MFYLGYREQIRDHPESLYTLRGRGGRPKVNKSGLGGGNADEGPNIRTLFEKCLLVIIFTSPSLVSYSPVVEL